MKIEQLLVQQPLKMSAHLSLGLHDMISKNIDFSDGPIERPPKSHKLIFGTITISPEFVHLGLHAQ